MAVTEAIARAAGPPLDPAALLLPSDYPRVFAARHPDKPALVFGERRTSFADLDRLASAMVTVLREAGIGAGGRIAYIGRNSDLFIPVFFGAIGAGAVLVPVNWRNTAPEIRYVLDDCDASLIILDREFADTVRNADDGRRRKQILVDDPGPDGLAARLDRAVPSPRLSTEPDLPCLQLYTSGTTGRPKGVPISERVLGLGRLAELVSPDFANWEPDEILLSSMPNFHIAGIGWILCGLVRGATCVLTADPSPTSILDLCVRHAVTRTYMVPAVLRTVMAEMRARGLTIPAMRGIHYGAAVMDLALLGAAIREIGCGFLQYYGMTEIAGSATILGPANHDMARPKLLRSVGRPIPGMAVEIRDAAKRPCPIGVPGEIWIRGATLMPGYAGLPEATAEAIEDGWYRSGDGGYLDADGFLFLTDRIKDMIITGGENVYPVEVEAVLRLHPAVAEVGVFGIPDEKWGEMVVAAIELRPGHELDQADLIRHARASLAGYKVPKRLLTGLALPRTASGKVQRGALRRNFLAGGAKAD